MLQKLETEVELYSVEYFSIIDKIDTDDVKPTYHVLDLANVFRLDEVKESAPDKILQGVPHMKNKWVKAPRMT